MRDMIYLFYYYVIYDLLFWKPQNIIIYYNYTAR